MQCSLHSSFMGSVMASLAYLRPLPIPAAHPLNRNLLLHCSSSRRLASNWHTSNAVARGTLPQRKAAFLHMAVLFHFPTRYPAAVCFKLRMRFYDDENFSSERENDSLLRPTGATLPAPPNRAVGTASIE